MNQVRLVSDLQRSKEYYNNQLGCTVDSWGHAERKEPRLGFILYEAEHADDVRPNRKPRAANYPKQWEGPLSGIDTYAYTDWDRIDDLLEQFRSDGAVIHYEMKLEDQGDMLWKEFAVSDPDQYVIVFGAGKMK
ncbi:VOC family protein [Paenibacillus sp. H1-7]|uniref:VOC family protein n=1 Tax=Paenibacillus sp. H1-7 TaxID=2282849 RepID=UPI001EF78E06|nr:VOC family protein [Paenibacillus sp. H1-7]ULL18090.1 VOC family protein [Paenibacillus sp. H1-7]